MRLIRFNQVVKGNFIMRGEFHAYDSEEEYKTYKAIWERAGFIQTCYTSERGKIEVTYTRVIDLKG